MAFDAAELSSIANAALDYHFRGQPLPQTIQEKPLLRVLEANRKTFPGGKGDITHPVKGAYEFVSGTGGDLTGYTHNDTVAYGNIAGIERVTYPWREVHTGFEVTFTELKMDGIEVTDSLSGGSTRKHSEREMTAITNIMQDKVETFAEILAKQLNDMLWGDGTGDALGFLGLQHFLDATPAVGTTGGYDRATYAWWRNRYQTWVASSTDLPAEIHKEMRQLRRYGGRPTVALAGSDFLDALIADLRASGTYTDSGWSRPQSTDISIADVHYRDLKFEYDPTIDDLGLAGQCFIIDPRRLFCYAMQGEWGKDHNPARPHDVYAVYKARTYTGQLIANQLNCHGRYAVT